MADEIEETEPNEVMPEELWFDPLTVIDTLTTAMYNIGDCGLAEEDLKAIHDDFTKLLFQCTKLVKATIKEQIKPTVK